MTLHQAKNIINILSQEWKIEDKDFLLEIIKYLDKKVKKEYNFRHYFEFSLIENEPKIRLLHLFFWQPNLSQRIVKKIIEEREKKALFIFRRVSRKFKCFYNLSLLWSFFQFNKKTGLWPIQFGLEYQKNSQPKIKIYLSLQEYYPERKERFSLRKFCEHFNLDYKSLVKLFGNKKFDTVAIDFLPDNSYFFKFYPFIKNKGKLYRVLSCSKIDSKKSWIHSPQGIKPDDILDNLNLSVKTRDLIKENQFRIYYLTKENGKKGFYFSSQKNL